MTSGEMTFGRLDRLPIRTDVPTLLPKKISIRGLVVTVLYSKIPTPWLPNSAFRIVSSIKETKEDALVVKTVKISFDRLTKNILQPPGVYRKVFALQKSKQIIDSLRPM